jgi:hypothetical protein
MTAKNSLIKKLAIFDFQSLLFQIVSKMSLQQLKIIICITIILVFQKQFRTKFLNYNQKSGFTVL